MDIFIIFVTIYTHVVHTCQPFCLIINVELQGLFADVREAPIGGGGSQSG